MTLRHENADHIIDLGPEAGSNGEITAQGSYERLKKIKIVLQVNILQIKKLNKSRRLAKNGRFVEINGASGNNLNNVNLKIPTEHSPVLLVF